MVAKCPGYRRICYIPTVNFVRPAQDMCKPLHVLYFIILKKGEHKNILKIVQKILSMHGRNSDTERAFLLENAKPKLDTDFQFSCKKFPIIMYLKTNSY